MKIMDARQRLVLVFTALIATAGCAAPLVPPGFEREEVIEVGTPTVFLTCPPEAAASPVTRSIGAGGGELATGRHRLAIPAGAVATERSFTLREQTGERVGVDIEQAGDSRALARPATLWIDAGRCSSNAIGAREWFIWRMNPTGGPSQKLRTRMAGSRFMVQIDSTSGFIIAN
jgi:hypothetical protein